MCMDYDFDSPFVFRHDKSIIQPKDLGLVNSHIAVGTPYTSVAALAGLYAPPYASSDFSFDVRFMGEIISAQAYTYVPNAIHRAGRVNGVTVETLTSLPDGMRSAIVKIELTNPSGDALRVPLQAWIGGGVDYVHQWEFSKPVANKAADLLVAPESLTKINNDKAWIVSATTVMRWFAAANLWEGEVTVPAAGRAGVCFIVSLGSDCQARAEQAAIRADVEGAIASASKWLRRATDGLFDRLPRFTADDARLQLFYDRSLVVYLTNRWQVDEFVLNPYLSTGSINGGCLCSYLWDYSGGWKLHPLLDPQAERAQLRQFLKIDLSRAFAFTPVDGAAYGPWYPVNQEKIIALVYYYVKYTGDTGFLRERLGDQTVLECIVSQAMLKDDPARPFALYDYGVDGEHHLELRRGFPYHGVLPDLNARRYMGYLRAYELTEAAGEPLPMLLERAAQLKAALRDALWDDARKWFVFKPGGRTDIRYTVQMFKLIDSPVLDRDMLDGLISHLDETEFLSSFGLHSMSKLDPAYDQVDIDNGGGGICTLFVPLIAEKLYRMGYVREGNDLLRRVLWWGERVPYWGDSFTANAIEYRQDTPLQATIGAVVGAQTVIFGMFGIHGHFDGSVTIDPIAEHLSGNMKLTGMRLLGKQFDVALLPDGFVVHAGGERHQSSYGTPIRLR